MDTRCSGLDAEPGSIPVTFLGGPAFRADGHGQFTERQLITKYKNTQGSYIY